MANHLQIDHDQESFLDGRPPATAGRRAGPQIAYFVALCYSSDMPHVYITGEVARTAGPFCTHKPHLSLARSIDSPSRCHLGFVNGAVYRT